MRFSAEQSERNDGLTGIECALMAWKWMPESFNDGVVAARVSGARDIITVSSLFRPRALHNSSIPLSALKKVWPWGPTDQASTVRDLICIDLFGVP